MKAMKIPVLAFEHQDEVKLIMSALRYRLLSDSTYPTTSKEIAGRILDECCKIDAIFVNTNNN